ncbi:type II secretion system F family protein [Cumulibacter manganitolerans]|uniref:type II secretion system F family protein n=1 Tax=Cumulibacter manganitolerans TaxID=1884992 RepID=UPI001295B7FB|nr:type II secretion system F family protein [Cumulibacter manganitolerans]
MTGALLGLTAGLGLLLIYSAFTSDAPKIGPKEDGRRRRLLNEAGLPSVSSAQLWLLQLAAAALIAVLVLLATSSVAIAALFGAFGFVAPLWWVRRLHGRRQRDLREVWPEAIDHLISAVRAGMSIPEALGALSTRGPEALREPFAQFDADYRTSGRFTDCLDDLKDRLADPIGDRVCETMRVTREVGGNELGTVLRTLGRFVREESRIRGEIESRKQAAVNGARLAAAAPWLVLLLLGTQSTTLAAYDTPLGFIVLLCGAAVCVVAYRLMLRLGRLPEEARVLR